MWLAFLFGVLTLTTQTLLLRRFLWHFDATDLGVGVFVATWLAWTGAGAALARTRVGRLLVSWLSAHAGVAFPALALLAFAQHAILVHGRAWLGVPDYLAFPIVHLIMGCLLANAPFCLGAGVAFPALCQRAAERGRGVSGAFAAEALGAAVAGVGVVALLVAGVPLDWGGGGAWQRVFRSGAPDGQFATPAGTYVQGVSGGTFYVLGAGGTREMLPERDRAFESAALLLAQRPYAADALALGRVPLATCLAVAELQPGCRVTWCPDDPVYARAVIALARSRDPGGAASRMVVPGVTPNAFLATNQTAFGLVWVVPPPPASAAGAAWWQPALLTRLRAALKPDGVAAFALGLDGLVRTATGQALLASQVDALTDVWPECGRLVAGAGGWWLACARNGGVFVPDDAAERFALLHAAGVPPQVVLDIYSPSRAADVVNGTAVPAVVDAPLIVASPSDRTSAIRWLALAVQLRREWPGAGGLERWMLQRLERGTAAGVPVMLLLAGLWMLPVAVGRRATGARRAAQAWLAATGFMGLATLLGLMQTLELRFGNLYLLAGLASACYLAGLFVGNRLGAVLRPGAWPLAPVVVTTLQLAVTWLVWQGSARPSVSSGLLIAACGVCALPAGAAVPVAGVRLGEQAGAQGAGLLLADAWGSAIGGLLFAVVLLPCLGGGSALLLVALLVAGVTICACVPSELARFAAAVAAVTCLVAGCLAWRAEPTPSIETPTTAARSGWQGERAAPTPATNSAYETVPDADAPAGQTRRVDMERVRRLWSTHELSTHAAEHWQPESTP